MRTLKWLIVLGLVASSSAYSSAGPAQATANVTARLVSETSGIAPGQTIWLALELNIRAGWHTYWRNPGDSGEATSVAWTLPNGLTAGAIVWPAPHRFDLPPLVNYGYADHVMHLIPLTAAKTLDPGTPAVLTAKASWLVCSDVCIPEDVSLQLTLPTAAAMAGPDPGMKGLFAAARATLPSPEPAATHVSLRDGRWVIELGKEWGNTLSRITALSFFPEAAGSVEYAAPQILTRSRDAIQLALKAGDQTPKDGVLRGVLMATEQNGSETITLPIEIGARSTEVQPMSATLPLPSLVLLAILGGLILNLMPCVFPVLSIKAMGLVEQAKTHPAAVRRKGLVFAAGVITSMLALAVVLLTLRAGGEQIGWGFQLQSPLFVTLMIYLLLAVGLNLSGVFEIGGGLAGVGDGLTRGDSARAAFFTGVLTTLVATPCTAPFMAAAVGAALSQPPAVALTIFAALGFGLALPYLLISFAPWMRRALPRPGAWMDTLKQLFAFPMYGSAAWLLWVLAQQTSALGFGAALGGALLVALAAWAYQKSKLTSSGGRVTALATVLISILLAVLLPVRYAGVAAAAAVRGGSAATAPDEDGWQRYDATRAAELAAAGKPLLINFTASWCLTCLVNERNAFGDAQVRQVFRGKGVTLMKGDWTNQDPAITKALASFGRAGVPLYVVYNAKTGAPDPLILPQLLTAGVVRDTFGNLPDRDLK